VATVIVLLLLAAAAGRCSLPNILLQHAAAAAVAVCFCLGSEQEGAGEQHLHCPAQTT
jgi:hypothetical protein